MGSIFTKKQEGASYSPKRGLSHDQWHQSKIEEILLGSLDAGFGFIDDFVSNRDVDDYVLTQATTGTFALDDAKGGVVLLDSASATDNQGGQVQRGDSTTGEMFIPNANADVYFETRIKVADIGTGTINMFAGLSEEDLTIFLTGANSSTNHIGFEKVDDDLILHVVNEKAGTRTETSTGIHTLVDGDWVKLGFRVYGVDKIEFFVNGAVVATHTTNVPIVEMKPSFVCHSAGTTDPIMHIDWVACCQEEEVLN